MIKNYLKIGFRNFKRGLVYSVINLLGLAVGLASVMMIVAYISYELSFDKHFPNSNRIFQLVMESRASDPMERTVWTPEPLGRTLIEEFPEIGATTILIPYESTYLVDNHPIKLKSLTVSPNFLQIFDLPLVKGDASKALQDESGVVLTRRTAEKLFQNTDPIGKTIGVKTGDKVQYQIVTGVAEDIPANTHFQADLFESRIPNSRALDFRGYSSCPQYILTKPNTDAASVEARLQNVLSKYHLDKKTSIKLLPLTDIHLRAGKINGKNLNLSDVRYVYIFGSVALLILLIGCINYVNLTTAQALQRVKEVGIRKTLGSGQGQLAFQFIGESFLFFTFAILLAILISVLAWPVFNNLLQVDLPVMQLFSIQNVMLFLAIALVAGLLSGVYSALFLSRMRPAGILKDGRGEFRMNFSLRKVLIVFQFSISMILIVATIIVWQQLHLFNNRPLGFAKDHLLILPSVHLDNQPEAFKKKLLDNPNIRAVSLAELELGNSPGNTSSMFDPADSTRRLHFAFIYGDFDFVKTMGIKVADGRDFSQTFASDRADYDSLYQVAMKKDPKKADQLIFQVPIIITQSLAKSLRLKKPVDEVIRLGALQGKVIGVVKDFQITTLKEESPLLVYKLKTSWYSTSTYVRLDNRNIPESIRYIEQTWKAYFPEHPFRYTFADDNLQKLYESENRLASIFTSFALLAIAISALGLFSLVALFVKQRTKEIGIRKVLGASVPGIALLLSRDFVILIIVAATIASPLAWYGANLWLQDFTNRIHIDWWVFVLAGALVLLTGMLTVSLQTIRAARANPIKSISVE